MRTASTYRRAVFRVQAPTLNTLPVNANSYQLRIHASDGASESIKFATLQRGDEMMLARYLAMDPTNCHVVVSASDPVDIFVDMEAKCGTWRATQTVLKAVVTELEKQVRAHGAPGIDKLLVLDASDIDRCKQSLHLHIRLDKPVATRKDVRHLLQQVQKALPGAIASWIDPQPCVSGSLRLMLATTISRRRPLLPLQLDDIEDEAFRAYLREKSVQSERMQMEMSLIKRFDASPDGCYAFEPPAREGAIEDKAEWKQLTKNFNISDVMASQKLQETVMALSQDHADEYPAWSKVLWALKSIATADPEYEEEIYLIFDEFSQLSASKYTPEFNRKVWDRTKGSFPKSGWYALRRLAKETW
ncbi:hypothetical protein DIPPA_10069 [Diplonema papillatum]|nr:hypothetical protein DIPPA_10069 [Diplonema papillatum]